MDFLSKPSDILPIKLEAALQRKVIVRYNKLNILDLEVCKPKGIIRERPFWVTEKLDFYHLLENGTIRHTPGD